jgi:hypothetical protein
MSTVENLQVVLTLTDNKETLAALRKNGRFRKFTQHGKTEEVYTCSFDGKSIEFRHGMHVPLPKSIADALRRDNWVIVGEHIDGEIGPVFEVVKNYVLGAEQESRPQFACPVCKKDMINSYNLGRHLMGNAHKEKAGEGVVDYEEAESPVAVVTALPAGDDTDEGGD